MNDALLPLWVRSKDDVDDDDEENGGKEKKMANQLYRVATAIACAVLVGFAWLFALGLVVSHREEEEVGREGMKGR